ncbi:hypothetical protein V1264_013398 [Littorina saxatilis]|uniref:EGF-like domain-containing protein n=2 Tax=Littorina saxatilis TaxID=31220 RepID=A0AAN9BNN5_9CAEN
MMLWWKVLLGVVITVVILFITTVHCETVRSTHFTVCRGRKKTHDVIGSVSVTSRLQCVSECASQVSCRSCSYCTVGESKTCTLSTDQQSSCTTWATLDSQCSMFLMVDVCQNGGVYDKQTSACVCVQGWQGTLCQTAPTTTTPTATTTTTVPTPTTTSTIATTTTIAASNECVTGDTACAGVGASKEHSGVTYCCPSGSIKTSTINGAFTCSCP